MEQDFYNETAKLAWQLFLSSNFTDLGAYMLYHEIQFGERLKEYEQLDKEKDGPEI